MFARLNASRLIKLAPSRAKSCPTVISPRTTSTSTSSSSPSRTPESCPPPSPVASTTTNLAKTNQDDTSLDARPNKEGAINATVIWRDEKAIETIESSQLYEPDPVFLPEPVKQEWIARIPVEYHATLAEHFNNDTEWLPIFRMPYVSRFRTLIRVKVYVTGLSLGVTGYKMADIFAGNYTFGGINLLFLSSLSLGALIFAGDYFRRIACSIYVTRDLQFVRVARFTFLGTRRDIVLPVERIVPLPELNSSYRKPLFKMQFSVPDNIDLKNDDLEFYDNGLRLFVKFGGILDRERFKLVMGNVFNRINE